MASRLQFSIRFLLVATAAVAVPIAVLSREPTALSGAAAVMLAMMAAAMTCSAVCATSGYRRSFFVGGSIPAVLGAFYAMFSLLGIQWASYASLDEAAADIPFKAVFAILWASIPLAGLSGLAANYLVHPHQPTIGKEP